MKRLNSLILMFDEPVVILLSVHIQFNHVVICLATFLFDVSIYPQSLCTTAWVCAFIAPILKLRFLTLVYSAGVVSAVG